MYECGALNLKHILYKHIVYMFSCLTLVLIYYKTKLSVSLTITDQSVSYDGTYLKCTAHCILNTCHIQNYMKIQIKSDTVV